jgi:glycosyltransferase involved in cell wall biosynthesis
VKIVVDGRPLVGHRTGIGVHTAEIARRLEGEVVIASHAPIADRAGLEGCTFRVDEATNGILWQQLLLPKIEGDVVWGPHGTLPVGLRTPAVVTLHDLTSITMPGRHRLKTVLSFNLFIGRSLMLARRIAAVSRATADQASRGFGVPRRLIEIVPNGVDAFFSPGGEEGDSILFVGTLEPRKGLDDLMAVYRSLPAPRPRLILAGDTGWKTRVAGDGVEVRGFVSREELRDLYRSARVFVYPSRYEGFGIPPLEAMACGAPVVATRTGAIPEYAGDAALLVNPGDRDALRSSLLRLLHAPGLRRDLGARAAERATHYRWEGSARTMQQLFEAAAR